jgi:hypothetical protein
VSRRGPKNWKGNGLVEDSEPVNGITYVAWYVYLTFQYHNTVRCLASATISILVVGSPNLEGRTPRSRNTHCLTHCQFQQGISTGKMPTCLLTIIPTDLFINVFANAACIHLPHTGALLPTPSQSLYLTIISYYWFNTYVWCVLKPFPSAQNICQQLKINAAKQKLSPRISIQVLFLLVTRWNSVQAFYS